MVQPVHDVHLVAPLHAQQGGQQTDRPGPEHQSTAPAPQQEVKFLPRLAHDAGRFQEHAGHPQVGVDAHRLARRQAEPLGPEAVPSLYATLSETVVLAQVGLTCSAQRTRDGVGGPYDADHQVSYIEPGTGRALQDPAQGLVPDDQAVAARR